MQEATLKFLLLRPTKQSGKAGHCLITENDTVEAFWLGTGSHNRTIWTLLVVVALLGKGSPTNTLLKDAPHPSARCSGVVLFNIQQTCCPWKALSQTGTSGG